MAPACTAYTRYVLDIGQSEDWFALQVALAPCLLGYGHIARRLFDDPETKREGNPYWDWVLQYVADDYTAAVRTGAELMEKHAVRQSPARIEQLVKIFIHATKVSGSRTIKKNDAKTGADGDGILGHGVVVDGRKGMDAVVARDMAVAVAGGDCRGTWTVAQVHDCIAK